MKNIIALILILILISCSKSSKIEHKYLVISNNYTDTCEITASDYSTRDIIVPDGWHNKVIGTKTTFTSSKGDSEVLNVNKIIAQ